MSSSPLLESTRYYVLLALAVGPMHGSAVRDQIGGDTLGVYMRDSTLYAVLKSLARDGLVEGPPDEDVLANSQAMDRPVGGASSYRKVYHITAAGKRRLEQESLMFRRAAQLAQGRLGYRG